MRLDDRAAKAVAERIAEEHRAVWSYVDVPIKRALIDAGIMAHIRAAWAADADKPFTAGDLIGFSDRVVVLLMDGVGRGHRRIRLLVDTP